MNNQLIYASLFCLGLTSCASEINEVKTPVKKPNIVLFFVDDLGWGDLGMRNAKFESPNVDKLAAQGLNFENTYVASPTCSPSRATLVTGQHPARLKMVRHIPTGPKWGFDKYNRPSKPVNYWKGDPANFPVPNWLDTSYTTYAEALKEQGYYNHFVGKWHLGHEGYHPIDNGFDTQFGTTNFGHPKGYNAPFFKNTDTFKDAKKPDYLTDKLTEHTVDWIENYDKDEPFMLSMWFYNVHRPSDGKPEYVEHFEKQGLTGDHAQYAAQIKSMDDAVGKVRQALKEKGLADNTIILFTSDQGGYFENPPYRGKKQGETLYEGGARVPFFVYWPGVTKPGTINDSVVQTTDIFPTLAEISGGTPSDYENLDGVSLVSTIKENNLLNRNEPIYGYRAYQDLYVSVREKEWKLLGYRSGDIRLYNLAIDPTEKNDVVEQNPDIVKKLIKKLLKWERKMGVEQYSGFKQQS